MASGKAEKKNAKKSLKRSSSNSLGPKRGKSKHNKPKQKVDKKEKQKKNRSSGGAQKDRHKEVAVAAVKSKKSVSVRIASPPQQLEFFLDHFQSACDLKLSSLETESITENCIVELPLGIDQDAGNLGEHVKIAFGASWEDTLCGNQTEEGNVEPGSPAILVFSASALRSLDLLRGMHSLTRKCPAAKLFSKHMKVENQVSLLKNRINIASGTPNRIKKLIEMEVLGLSRLDVIVLDMQLDVKGFFLFSLPQVRDEFWDLYKTYFHRRLLQGKLRICLYGPIPISPEDRTTKRAMSDE